MSGWCSMIFSTNFSGATCTPRSITSKPAPSSMMLTRFLPMSCTSPLTVPIRNLPIVCTPVSASSGRSTSIAPAIARPAISISGTKKSPRSKRAPTSSRDGDQRVEQQGLRLHRHARAPGGSGRAPRVRCRAASRRTSAAGSLRGSMGWSCRALLGRSVLSVPFWVRRRSSLDSASACSTRSRPMWSTRSWSRAVGPETPSAAKTPSRPSTGAAISGEPGLELVDGDGVALPSARGAARRRAPRESRRCGRCGARAARRAAAGSSKA